MATAVMAARKAKPFRYPVSAGKPLCRRVEVTMLDMTRRPDGAADGPDVGIHPAGHPGLGRRHGLDDEIGHGGEGEAESHAEQGAGQRRSPTGWVWAKASTR